MFTENFKVDFEVFHLKLIFKNIIQNLLVRSKYNLQVDKISLNFPKSRIKERTEFLISFLDLPPENRLVGKLSGGQQRRASLAAALLHEPELLILDEPTVGVDPLLRQCIWDHLLLVNSRHCQLLFFTKNSGSSTDV